MTVRARYHMHWTEEMDAELRLLWPFTSTTKIAEKMGPGMTPAIVGWRALNLRLEKRSKRVWYDVPETAWMETAAKFAKWGGVALREVVGPERNVDATRARWAAIRALKAAYPACSLRGIRRVTGFDTLTIRRALTAAPLPMWEAAE